MLNYPNQPMITAFDDVTLTDTYADNAFEFEVNGFSKLSLDIDYARGSAEASSKLSFKVEHSPDKINWFSLVIDETSTVSSITERVWEVADTATLNVVLDIAYRNLRISAIESSVSSNAGTLTMYATLSGL